MSVTVAVPKILTDPGVLWIAPIGTTETTNTVSGSVFTDAISSPWIALGATVDGSEFKYSTTVEPIRVMELFDPVKYVTTEREGSIAFALASWTLSNYQRAVNGGITALTPSTGTGATSLTKLEPPNPGDEVRSMVLWESTDQTVRLLLRQTLQTGEITSAFKKAPDFAAIPCEFSIEAPSGGAKPWVMWGAGADRV